jgi:hypothetical protein
VFGPRLFGVVLVEFTPYDSHDPYEPTPGHDAEPDLGLGPDAEPGNKGGPDFGTEFAGFGIEPSAGPANNGGSDHATEPDAEPVAVPEELSVLPPGAVLCELLDDLPVQAVSGFDSVELVAAAYRQLCRQQAVFYEALVETGLRAQGSASTVARLSAPGEFACEEARAKLVWSRHRAQADYVLGYDLFVRHPELGAAMKAGRLDLPRARVFVSWTDGLTDAQAGQVIDRLLPQAAEMVLGELVDQIKRACLAIDPDWAARKYKAAVKTRKVRGYRNPDGTAALGGFNQPVDRVTAACAHIDRLARACKRAGDRRTIDLIRSDIYLGMLDGTFEAMIDDQIIEYVLTNPLNDLTGTPDPTDSGTSEDGGDGDDEGDGGNGSGRAAPTEPNQPESSAGPTPSESCPTPDQSCTGSPRSSAVGSPRSPATQVQRPVGVAPPPPALAHLDPPRGHAVPELRIQLTTLLGHDEQPAQLPGWDYLPAWLARQLVAGMYAAEWRWVVCGRDGHPVNGGLTPERPNPNLDNAREASQITDDQGRASERRDARVPARGDPRRGGIVELAIYEDDLLHLAQDPEAHGAWASVIADVGTRHARSGGRGGVPSTRRTAAAAATDAGRRVPGARLRRWIQLRDRTCAHPCCRAPAATTDIDHRTRWRDGGPTTEANLGPACRHDHRLKDEGGWHAQQAVPGVTVWTSPLGHRILFTPPPVIPTPMQIQPRDDDLEYIWIPSGASWRDPCICLVRPCPHTRLEHTSEETKVTDSNSGRPSQPGSPAIYDDGVPPF